MRDNEDRYYIIWGNDNFWGSIGLFIIIVIGMLVAAIIPLAGFVINLLSIIVPIGYFIINLLHHTIPGFAEYGVSFIVPALIRLGKSALIGYFIVYDTLKSIEIPDVEELSGLFDILGTGINFFITIFMIVGVILIILIIDYGEMALESHLIEDSVIPIYVVCILTTIVFIWFFIKYVF